MPGQNLTRLEAEQRSTLIAVDSYQVTIDVTAPGDTFVSTTTVNFTAQPGSSTFIDLIAESIDTITLNGRSLTRKASSTTHASPSTTSPLPTR